MRGFLLILTALTVVVGAASCGGHGPLVQGTPPRVIRTPGGGAPPGGPYDPSPRQWVIRPYTDPVTGETYDIVDGYVIIKFKVDTASPEVETFIQQTGVTVVSEWPATQSMAFELPQGITVEYAVQNWPTMYPDVVESVYPDGVGGSTG